MKIISTNTSAKILITCHLPFNINLTNPCENDNAKQLHCIILCEIQFFFAWALFSHKFVELHQHL